jgi:hypothetical protein
MSQPVVVMCFGIGGLICTWPNSSSLGSASPTVDESRVANRYEALQVHGCSSNALDAHACKARAMLPKSITRDTNVGLGSPASGGTSISLTAINGATFQDIRQVRLGGLEINPMCPNPAAWLCSALGCSVLA